MVILFSDTQIGTTATVMATRTTNDVTNVGDDVIGLDELLQCPLCLEEYSCPKVLPCQHIFCLDCLVTYCSSRLKGQRSATECIPCPVCRKDAEIPGMKVENLPTSFMINSLKELVKTPKKSKTGGSTQTPEQVISKLCRNSQSRNNNGDNKACGSCGCHGDLTHACSTCYVWMCVACSVNHQQRPVTEHHHLISNTDVSVLCREVGTRKEAQIDKELKRLDQELAHLHQHLRQLPMSAHAFRMKITAVARECHDVINKKMADLQSEMNVFYRNKHQTLVEWMYDVNQSKTRLLQTKTYLSNLKSCDDGLNNVQVIHNVNEMLRHHIKSKGQSKAVKCIKAIEISSNIDQINRLQLMNVKQKQCLVSS